jgi:cytochrome P450
MTAPARRPAPPAPSPEPEPPPLAASGAGAWTARRDAGIRAVLADPRFTVPPPGPGGPPGTVSWLRAAGARFASGPEHRRRRAVVAAELARLDPAALHGAARELAGGELAGCGGAGDRAEVMGLLARRVPVAVLAARLGLADPLGAAAAVTAVAAGYFPGSGAGREAGADAGTAWLLAALRPAGPDLAVARITVLVQACDATAGLIGTALHRLAGSPADGAWPTGALLACVLRTQPPAWVIRRVAAADAEVGGVRVRAGDLVACDLEAAGRDPAARPGDGLSGSPGLAFGAGLRPCPAPGHALALASGVIDAVRARCMLQPGAAVTWAASPVRVPERLDVVLR